jgi:quercetin dioxygenase-like cupin family protein
MGLVIKGAAYNKMNNQACMVLREGEAWYEEPGCHHRISANFSEIEEMVLLATFVIETKFVEEHGLAALVQIDEEYGEIHNPTFVSGILGPSK